MATSSSGYTGEESAANPHSLLPRLDELRDRSMTQVKESGEEAAVLSMMS